jgi:tape measure domain-containing protein
MTREEIAVVASLKDDVSRHVRAMRGELGRLERAVRGSARTTTRQSKAFDAVRKSASGANRTLEQFSTGLRTKVASGARTAGIALTALSLAAGGFGLKAASNFEQTQIAFDGLLGSAREGQALFKELQQFNLKTPFGLEDLTSQTRMLLGFGFAGNEIMPIIRAVADTASGLGAGAEGLQRIVLNLGQVRAMGKVTGRELRDFATVGFPGYELVAHILGQTREEIKAMGDDAEVSADQFLAAVTSMAGPMQKFTGMADRQAQSLFGQWSNIKDLVTVGLANAAAPLVTALQPLIDTENGLLPKFLTTFISTLGPPLIRVFTELLGFAVKALPAIEPVLSALVDGAATLLGAMVPGLALLEPVMGELGIAIRDLVFALVPHMPELVDAFVAIVGLAPEMIGLLTAFVPLISPLAQVVGWLADLGPVSAAVLLAVLGWSRITGVFGAIAGFTGMIMGATKALLGLGTAQTIAAGGSAAAGGAGGLMAMLGMGVGAGAIGLGVGAGVAGGAALGMGLHKAGVEPLGGGVGDWFSRNITPNLPEWMGGLNARDRAAVNRDRPHARPHAAAINAMARNPAPIVLPAGAVVVNSPAATVDFERGLAQGLRRYEEERTQRR